jgi:cyanophycin synthetase
MAARDADRVVVVHKDEYLRGRNQADLEELYAAGAARVGVDSLPSYRSELEGLQALIAEAEPGDVVAVMTHQDRPALDAWLRAQGGTVDGADELRRKVLAAEPAATA